MPRFSALFFFAMVLGAQTPGRETPAPAPSTAPAEVNDPLERTTPQQAILHFLEAAHARDYSRATRYLDLRRMTAEQAKAGPELARQLEDLLDDTPFDIARLSRIPEGEEGDDLSEGFDHLHTFHVDGKTLDLQMQRVELRPGLRVWLVSAGSVSLIPVAHQLVAESPFEKKLPQTLVTFELFDTPVWRWIALALIAAVLWFAARLVTWALITALRRAIDTGALGLPLRICLCVAGLWAALDLAPPASVARLFIERALGLIFFLGLAWTAAAIIDLIADRWQARLDPRGQAISYSVLPLGRQVLKLSLFLVAGLVVVRAWGYNTSTILAGLGIGGLAIALAAQKTIENLFGGISVIGDRPVLVGDLCKFGERTGRVMHIGLRSTRIRTPERTIISVPNAEFSSMALENISGRDKIWFHPTLNLRRDTTSEQLSEVLSSFRGILNAHPRVETGPIPVRFVGVGPYSLDIEVSAYVRSAEDDEFLALQQELLLQMLRAVERAGTALAVPLQESIDSHHAAQT